MTALTEQVDNLLLQSEARQQGNLCQLEGQIKAELDKKFSSVSEAVREQTSRVEDLERRVGVIQAQCEEGCHQILTHESRCRSDQEKLNERVDMVEQELGHLRDEMSSRGTIGLSDVSGNPSHCPSSHTNHSNTNQVDNQVASPLDGPCERASGEHGRTTTHTGHRDINSFFGTNEISLPKFGNKVHGNPIQFIKEIESYFVMRGVPEEYKLKILERALVSDARSWMNIIMCDGDVMSYADFRLVFLAHFWDTNQQAKWRAQVFSGKYDRRRDGSMVGYFIRFIERASCLDPPVSEGELISAISQHFPSEIKVAIISSRPKNVKEAISLLRALDTPPSISDTDMCNFVSGGGARVPDSNCPQQGGNWSPRKGNFNRRGPTNSNIDHNGHNNMNNGRREDQGKQAVPRVSRGYAQFNDYGGKVEGPRDYGLNHNTRAQGRNRNMPVNNRNFPRNWRESNVPRVNRLQFQGPVPHWHYRNTYRDGYFRPRLYGNAPYPRSGQQYGQERNRNRRRRNSNNGRFRYRDYRSDIDEGSVHSGGGMGNRSPAQGASAPPGSVDHHDKREQVVNSQMA